MGALQRAAIYGTGAYVPQKVLNNDFFATTLDTSDEWITTRTGIKERHIAAPGEATTDLAVKASRAALADAKVDPEEIDLILVATVTPDHIFPASACILQNKLGLAHKEMPALDLNAACSGFIFGISTAQAYIASGMARRILVVGAETLSRIADYTDRSSCILFGDGAGAAVLGPCREDGSCHPILSSRIHSDGRLGDALRIPAGGSALPTSPETAAKRLHYMHLEGREVFRFAITKLENLIRQDMEQHGLKAKDVGAIIPHQANLRIVETAAKRLDLPMELFLTNIHKYGNTSAASIPIALDEFGHAGKLPSGKPVILVAFGGGLTWASAVIQW
jgi:3-oxoacyl-[acyl-carrier-protein] synthase-3